MKNQAVLKNQGREFQPDLRAREAHAAFAQDSHMEPESFKGGFKEGKAPFKTMKPGAIWLSGILLFGLAVPGFGQAAPGRLAAAHPVPSAPKKSYAPASFYALPELQCQLYPAGGTPSQGITVFTDDDGYARFHAVHTAPGDAIERLAADCTNPAGKSSSYSVDLTSNDTFRSRPVNLASERGTDRPALRGDPLSYTQSELIQAGYGPRPDPADSAAYAHWLAAASMPGRMLEAKRPHPPSPAGQRLEIKRPASPLQTTVDPNTSVHPEGQVVQTPGQWWVGSTLNGAKTYVSSEATFNVPTAIPGGDETLRGTQIAIWNGVNGDGLIQGGVGVQTTSVTASYWSFREYCCGDGVSNNYGGAFTPNPGDIIFSIEYYCDSQGGINPNGGYGCTFLQDNNTGAILNCTLSQGSPCPSVPALAKWTSFGTDADFVIEGQTPQMFPGWKKTTAYTPGQIAVDNTYPYICLLANTNQEPSNQPLYWALYPLSTAFTDFAPQVTMFGSAFSTTTDSYSQTVTSDPLVYLLVDSTDTTSHIIVSLGPSNQTNFTSSQFKQVSGSANNGTRAESIGVGPNAGEANLGDAWMLGYTANSSGDYNIYQWQEPNWVLMPGAATRIAVSPNGYPWVVNHLGQIFYWNGNAFVPAPGNACASWISVGPNANGLTYGDPWILGCTEGSSGYSIYQLQGSSWVLQPGHATKLAVGPFGPWTIDTTGSVFYWAGNGFVKAPGSPCATDIAVTPLLVPFTFVYGDAWITGCTLRSTGYDIYQLQQNGTWLAVPGQANQISLSPDLGVPWIVDAAGHIYQ